MKAAQLYGKYDLRVGNVVEPQAPGTGEVLLQVGTVGVCGSDLHNYQDGRIGDTTIREPFILGHEFAGTIAAVGSEALDGMHQPLQVGQRVAVDPAIPCWRCDLCEAGNPNLCRKLKFMGLYPEHGALQESVLCPARNCFPLPDNISLEVGALLEPLGIAIHAVDLAKIRVGRSLAVLGCGPIGLLIMRLAKLSGASPIYASDQFSWRLDAAHEWGADEVINIKQEDPIAAVRRLTNGRGVSTVIEAAWVGEAAGQAVEMADLGGRIVFVGIPGDDHLSFKHSSARRKGLTMLMCRRMKHTYPRAIALATSGWVPLERLVSHRFVLEATANAFDLNDRYQDNVLKVMIDVGVGRGGE